MKIEHFEDDFAHRSITSKKSDQRSMTQAKSAMKEQKTKKGDTQVVQIQSRFGAPEKKTEEAKWQRIELLWEGIELSLLRYVYWVLKQRGLVQNGQDFSQSWCGKNPNWFSYQTTKGRTFSLDAAINCLLELRQYIKYQTDAPEEYHKAIDELADLITQFLAIKYRVAGIADRSK